MNYTSAALGVIGAISLLTWITTGRKKFTGPVLGNAVGDENGPGESVEKASNNSDVDPEIR